MDHPWIKRASDMTTSERRYRMEKLLMAHNDDTPSRPIPAVTSGQNGLPPWTEMGRLILAEQQETKELVRGLVRKVDRINVDLAVMKTKAAFAGLIGGAGFTLFIEWVKKGWK